MTRAECTHANWYVQNGQLARCIDCNATLPTLGLTTSPCKWCSGEGAVRDEQGKLGADCPRCKGRGRL